MDEENLHGFGFWVERDELVVVDDAVFVAVDGVQQRIDLHEHNIASA